MEHVRNDENAATARGATPMNLSAKSPRHVDEGVRRAVAMAREAAQDSRNSHEYRPEVMFIKATTSLFAGNNEATEGASQPSHIEISSTPINDSPAATNRSPEGIRFDLKALFGQAKGAFENMNFAKPSASDPKDVKGASNVPDGNHDGFFGWNLWGGDKDASTDTANKENCGNANLGSRARGHAHSQAAPALESKLSQNPFMQHNLKHVQSNQRTLPHGVGVGSVAKQQDAAIKASNGSSRRISSDMQVSLL